MDRSILDTIKEGIPVELDETAFDTAILMHINNALMNLNQIGVGPSEGFRIKDKTATWGDLIGNNIKLAGVEDYIFIKVKLIFDPPPSSSVVASMEKTAEEIFWRLREAVENKEI